MKRTYFNKKTVERKIKYSLSLLFGLVISLSLTSCITTRVVNLQRISDKDIEVYMLTKPKKEYVELKYIQADGGIFNHPEKLLQELVEKAKEEGSDAVINIHYDYQFWWPYVSGIAIKYKDK